MARWLDPWILNVRDAKGAAKAAKAAKGAMSPFGAGWQPPEQFEFAKQGNDAFWCPRFHAVLKRQGCSSTLGALEEVGELSANFAGIIC